MQYMCDEKGYDMGMWGFVVEITKSKSIWREDGRERILGFESVRNEQFLAKND